MKKAGKIALIVAGVVIVAGVAVTAWQWNNVKAAVYLMTMDQDTLTTRLDENRQVLDTAMEEYQITPYEFSQEQIDALASGELDPQALAAQLLAEDAAQQAASSPDPDSTTEPSATPAASTPPASSAPSASQSSGEPFAAEKAEIRELIATMYVLRATYVGKLEVIVQEAIDEYVAGEHTAENRQKVVYSKFDQLTALESECDAKVADVVSRLRTLLKTIGQDDTLAKEVEQTYQEEKSLKKAYYVQEFKNG